MKKTLCGKTCILGRIHTCDNTSNLGWRKLARTLTRTRDTPATSVFVEFPFLQNYTMPELTAQNVSQAELPPIADLYSISYTYYSCLGFAGVLVVGIIVSLASCKWLNTFMENAPRFNQQRLNFLFPNWGFFAHSPHIFWMDLLGTSLKYSAVLAIISSVLTPSMRPLFASPIYGIRACIPPNYPC